MTTTGPLFDKPMAELREAFVRARFAQEDVFGLPGIEAWLDEQRRRSSPYHDSDHEHYERWLSRLLGKAMMGLDPDRLLSQGATAHDAPTLNNRLSGPFLHTKHHFRPLLTGLTTLRGQEGHTVAVYCGHKLGAIVAVSDDRGEPRSFVVREAPGRTPSDSPSGSLIIDPLTSPQQAMEYVVDVLYAEWLDQLPKWRKARKFLCDALAEAIKRERAKAEHDFDTAVAVSADGTKIVHADWVLVFGEAESGSQDLRFAASTFMDQKILLAGTCIGCRNQMKIRPERNDLDGADWTVERFFRDAHPGTRAWNEREYGYRSMTAHTRAWPPEQKLLCLKDGRVLFVHRDQCPDPLPGGSVEVTV